MRKVLNALFLVFTLIIFSQENTFYHYGINDGLSQESVQTIIKDDTGFIWIGTQEGLNRYDGSSFKVFKNDIESSSSICGNDIKKIIEFKDYIFVGSKNNGVCYYDKTLNSFFKTTITKGTCTSLFKNGNDIYATILNIGLFKFEFKDNHSFKVSKIFDFNELLTNNLTSLYISNNVIYVGTNSGTIFHATIEKEMRFKKVKITTKTVTINTFYNDNFNFWIGTSNGLFTYNTSTSKAELIQLNNEHYSKTKKININKILNYNSNYYLATDNGLYILTDFNFNTKTFRKNFIYKGDKNNINSITSNRVYDLLRFKDALWIGTNKLDVLPLKKTIFKALNTKSIPNINNNHVYAVLKTTNYLFIGTRNGLNCIDLNNNTTILTKENTDHKLVNNVIRGLTKDHNNNLWIATTKGVSVLDLTNFNPKKPKLIAIQHDNNNPSSLSHDVTRSVFIDNKSNIWIATYGGGINLFTGDLETNVIKFKHFKASLDKSSLSSNFTFSINQTSSNTYWICSENGFNKIVFENDQIDNPTYTNFYKNLKDDNTLKSNSVLTSLEDQSDKNILWIGTDNGLHKFNIFDNTFKYFGTKNGLTNTVIYNILEDINNDLWVSTNSGIFQFNKNKERFVNYTINDGLLNSEYNLGAKFNDKTTHQLYFGGTNGLNYFSIDDLSNLYHEGDLYYTSLVVKGNEINVNSNTIISKNITKANAINLKFNDFPTKLTFADLNYNFPKSNDFVYKLKPNDQHWNPVTNLNEIKFLDLKSGNYELLIQGKGKDRLWSKKPLTITLTVSPPWYKSNLAYIIYFAIFLMSIYILYNFQLNRSLEKKESLRLKELDELKTKLYDNITHEFRTPLTVILGITENLKKNINPEKSSQFLEMIKRNSNNLLQLVNQILDLAKAEKGKIKLHFENDDIVKHLKYLTESFSSYAENKNISIIYNNDIDQLFMDFDKDKINKIITNLLSNAIKFSFKNSKIIVSLETKESDLTINVTDYGLGISKENIPLIFNRFYQVNSNNHTGSGIGLALIKELITLMKGTIKVQSKENVKTTFTVSLPIENKISKELKKELIKNNSDSINSDKPIALIVEDNIDVSTYIETCLENNYKIITANNGKDGIEKALTHTPDIIVSDVMMPKATGFELCKTLKTDEKTSHIPIILLTAKNSQEAKIKGLTNGADAYLTKPFNREELLIRIQKLISLRTLLTNRFKDVTNIKLKDKLTDINDIFIQKAINLINGNIENSNYHAKDLAENMNLSESQLYRKLKALSTFSTAIFIRKIRLQKANELLETTTKTISEICYDTGFNEPSWFSKTFKQEFGFSPSDKRK